MVFKRNWTKTPGVSSRSATELDSKALGISLIMIIAFGVLDSKVLGGCIQKSLPIASPVRQVQ